MIFMFDFFSDVISFFNSVSETINDLISGFINLITLFNDGVSYSIDCIQYLPTWVTSVATLSLGVSLVCFIIGR